MYRIKLERQTGVRGTGVLAGRTSEPVRTFDCCRSLNVSAAAVAAGVQNLFGLEFVPRGVKHQCIHVPGTRSS